MVNSRKALQTHLIGVISASITDWENDPAFTAPVDGSTYYKSYLMRGVTDNLTIDSYANTEENGILQVTLLYPIEQGTIGIETKAKAIIDHFIGARLTEGDIQVRVTGIPTYTTLDSTADRFIGAVSIVYRAVKI